MTTTDWKFHNGGPCPCPAGWLVDYQLRSGVQLTGGTHAESLRWDHKNSAGDITAWRLHK